MVPRVASSILLFALLTLGQECPPNPGTDPNEPSFGTPVPVRPEDIPNGCSDFEILAARGTSEIGKFGYRIGDPLIGNVTETLPGSRGYPVQYPASSDFANGVAQGGLDVVSRIESQSQLCPDQTFSLVGYSQGAMVMRSAIGNLSESLFEKVKSIVLFGDPEIDSEIPAELEAKLLENCATGDFACDRSGTTCPYGHITYSFPEWIEPAEDFIVKAFSS
ncbi:unnamed protein product [Clonostachys solani]|uniref:Cutinase n=1 Tax=Clonostachys solani TaxID=160281 RepID=A0A9P0EEV2_9HYPO|nr:unnamed protein product [Clonostachys solani]